MSRLFAVVQVVWALRALAIALALCLGCSAEPAAAPARVLGSGIGAASVKSYVGDVSGPALCSARIKQALAKPALPGAPVFEKKRAELLSRGKAEPVLFTRTPSVAAERTTEAQIWARQIDESPSPGYTLARMYKQLSNRPEVARQLLLREGYLYAESPSLASAMVEHVELHHLFDAPAVIIERGSERLRAVKGEKREYVYDSGPERGARARVLFLDRLTAEGDERGAPIHIELRSAQVRAGFDQMKVVHLTAGALVAEVRYGSHWVKSLFETQRGRAELSCELVPKAEEQQIAYARELAKRRQKVLEAKRSAILAQIDEALPFDEPLTEDGQQDGNLRPAWVWAYKQGWDSYQFNDDYYRVFDGAGRPKVPQVCIDFIIDTLERASGTWWGQQGAQRERLKGKLDFSELGIDNRRSVERFVRFARAHPEWFDIHDLSAEERVPFFDRERFFGHLLANPDAFLPGDIVVIHGPRDDGELHYHSFWIYDSDPVTGMPTLVASNAGRPRIRTWEFEMRVAPRRWIKHRIRPRLPWLEEVIVDRERIVRGPAPLASAPI